MHVRYRTMYRYLVTLLLISTGITTTMLICMCLGGEGRCFSTSRSYSAEASRVNIAVSANRSPQEVPVNRQSLSANHQERFLQSSNPNENILESVDIDYSIIKPFANHPERHTYSIKGRESSNKDILNLYSKKGETLRSKFNCKKLYDGDEAEQQKVTEYHIRHNYTYPSLSSDVVPNMLSDCKAFSSTRGYRTENDVSREEAEFPLAYVILVHLDFEHVERLLRVLFAPQNIFCIHVDAKASDSLKQALRSLVTCFPDNLMLSSSPQRIIYAHMSRLMADISCMRDIVNSKKPWRYLINMAATELPLKSNLDTIHILETMHGLNDIRETEIGRLEVRYEWAYKIVHGRMKKTKTRLPPPPHNMTIVKGLAYNTYSREFLDWAMTDQQALDLLTWSKRTFSPDEHYWASLNDLYHNAFLKTPGGFYGVPDKKGYITKFISWQQNPKHKCHGRVMHNICLFSSRDLPVLVGRRELAANKFDLTYDPVAYACMEEAIENRTKTSDPINLTPYKNLYFIRFDPRKDRSKRF